MRCVKKVIRMQIFFGVLFTHSPDHQSFEGHGKDFSSKNVGKLLEACEQGRDMIQLNILKMNTLKKLIGRSYLELQLEDFQKIFLYLT